MALQNMLKLLHCITAGLSLVLGTSPSFGAQTDETSALHDDADNANHIHVCDHECYEAAIVEAVSKGQFSRARGLAQQALHAGCGNPQHLAELYQQHSNKWLANCSECFANPNSSQQNTGVLLRQELVQPYPMDDPDCWSFDAIEHKGEDPLELWDKCCSQVSSALDMATKKSCDTFFLSRSHHSSHRSPSPDVTPTTSLPETCYRGPLQRMCCDFRHGTSSYLRLPALRELAIRLVAQTDITDNGNNSAFEVFNIEQDGFLRMYDTSTVLWPTGYLLSLCVAAPKRCGVPELYKAIESGSALELGAGIGIPSIALSFLHMHRPTTPTESVFATDVSRHGLVLTATNAHAVNASVRPLFLNHSNITAVREFRSRYAPKGFSVILGSALQDLFQESTREKDDILWNTLDILLAKHENYDSSIVLLSHTIHALQVPLDGIFERTRKISGDAFGMKTRWGASSEFEISVFRRRRNRQSKQSAPPTTTKSDEL